MSGDGIITASYSGGDAMRYAIRGHINVVDQPEDDRGPTPTELFVASLLTCMGFYAQRFLKRNHVDPDGLELTARFVMSDDRPARVACVEVDVALPDGVPDKLLSAVERVMDSCTVHNSLRQPPEVQVRLTPTEHAA